MSCDMCIGALVEKTFSATLIMYTNSNLRCVFTRIKFVNITYVNITHWIWDDTVNETNAFDSDLIKNDHYWFEINRNSAPSLIAYYVNYCNY